MKIRAIFIFEVLGRPPEHITQALDGIIKRIGDNKGIIIEKKVIHEPKRFEGKGGEGLFTSFAEVELATENIMDLFHIVLNYLPSNIEIIEPDNLGLRNFDLTEVLTGLTIKLHKYDEVAKVLTFENNNLNNQINDLQNRLKNLETEKKKSQKRNKRTRKTKK